MAEKPRLPWKREQEIAFIASETARARFPSGRVDPEEIARQAGIPFRYAAFRDAFDGTLLCQEGKFFLVCNESRAPRGSPRSRFTFAHELGHYFIASHREALASGRLPAHFSLAEFASDRPVEREADVFAANLLMPPLSVWDESFAWEDGIERVKALASFFGVSLTTAALQALRLELFPAPAAVFLWDPLGRLAGRRLSPETFTLDPDFRYMPSKPPADSLTAAALQGLSPGTACGVSPVLSWFPDATLECGTDLREDVASLGSFGWLTLLTRAAA